MAAPEVNNLALQFMRYANLPARVPYRTVTGISCHAELATPASALAPAYCLWVANRSVGMAVVPSNLPNVEVYLLDRLAAISHAVANQG